MSRIVITGGAGFIGTPLTRALSSAGHDLLIIDTNPEAKSKVGSLTGVLLVAQDIRSSEAMLAIKEFHPDSLIHLVAQKDVMTSVKDPVLDTEINVYSAIKIFMAAIDAGVKRILFASSGGAVYRQDGPFPTPEASAADPQSPYGIAKYAVELYLENIAKSRGISALSLRMSNVFGPGDEVAGVIPRFTKKLLKGEQVEIYGDGSATRDFLFVEDAAAAFVRALESKYCSQINISSGQETSLIELHQNICTLLGVHSKIKFGESRLGEIKRSVLDPGRALKELGWKPTISLSDGITACIRAWSE